MKYKHLLFDLDGTITDPKLGITKSVQYALDKMGIIESDLDKLEPFIGPPLKNSFEEIYSYTEEQASQAVEYNDGYVLYVATSKPSVFAKQILEYFQVKNNFELIVGSNLDGTMSDKTEIIRYIISGRELLKDNVIMIGDRKHDIIGANNNGIDSVGVGYGYGSERELRQVNCTYYIKTLENLWSVLS